MDQESTATQMVKTYERLSLAQLAQFVPQKVVVVIQVNNDGTFSVSPDPCTVSETLQGEVEWQLFPKNSPYDFVVQFDESPFVDKKFNKAKPNSGPVQGVPVPSYYAYTVSLVDDNTKELTAHKRLKPKDPGAIVTG